MSSIFHLRDVLLATFARADAEGRSSAEVADDVARARIVQTPGPSPVEPRRAVGGQVWR